MPGTYTRHIPSPIHRHGGPPVNVSDINIEWRGHYRRIRPKAAVSIYNLVVLAAEWQLIWLISEGQAWPSMRWGALSLSVFVFISLSPSIHLFIFHSTLTCFHTKTNTIIEKRWGPTVSVPWLWMKWCYERNWSLKSKAEIMGLIQMKH